MTVQFTIRRLLAITTIIGVALAILRRPLVVICQEADLEDAAHCFCLWFYDLLWLLGLDGWWPWTGTPEGGFTSMLAFMLGATVSIILHVALLALAGAGCFHLLEWSKKP